MDTSHELTLRTQTWQIFGTVAFAALCLLFSPDVYAQSSGLGVPQLQRVISWLQGNFGTLLAILAVIGLGFAAIAGKLNLTWAAYIFAGIILIWQASGIVNWLKF